MTQLSRAQRRVIDCLRNGGRMELTLSSTIRLRPGGRVQAATRDTLLARGLIRFVSSDGFSGTYELNEELTHAES